VVMIDPTDCSVEMIKGHPRDHGGGIRSVGNKVGVDGPIEVEP